MTRGSSRTSAGVPSAILLPKSSTTTLSEMDMTIAMWCSTSKTLRSNSSRTARISRPSSSTSEWVRPAAGSSRSSSRGRAASARAISMRLSVPYGRPDRGRGPRGRRARAASGSRAPRRAASAFDAARACTRRPARSRSPSAPGTVRDSGTCGRSRAGRCGARAGGAGRARRSRSSRSSGWYSRLTQLNSVVLPAPFGPMSAQIWPVVDREGQVRERDDAAELDPHLLDRQQRHRRPPERKRNATTALSTRRAEQTVQRPRSASRPIVSPGVSAILRTASSTPGMNDARS